MTRPSQGDEREGLVVVHFGLDVEVRIGEGERERVRVRPGAPALVVGDRVRLARSGPQRLERTTTLQRLDARGRTRAIAANLDVVGIAIASAPPAPDGYVDRGIVAARSAGIRPFLVVNKCDLPDAQALVAQTRSCWGGEGAGIPVFAVSATAGQGLDALRDYAAEGYRGAFIGTSGVGKSSLLNALVPGLTLETGEINRFTRLGRHVTTRSSLHELPDGGEWIDTPGFRDFVPVAVSPGELASHFAGFERALEQSCRFRDCLHRDEPGCSVLEQLAAGRLEPTRHVAYLRILEDLESAGEPKRRKRR